VKSDSNHSSSLSLLHRLLYASGHFGVSALAFTVVNWAVYFYGGSEERGRPARIDLGWLALALMVGRWIDACADPLVGFWSDRTRTRWGRRKPFIALGILPMALLFGLLWWTPVAQVSVLNFVYLLVVLSSFFFAFTAVACPYLALLPEIARSDRERVGLAALQGVFNVLGNVAGAVAGGWLIDRVGFGGMGLALGGVSALTFALACLGPRERYDAASAEPPLGLWPAIKQTLANRPFLHFGGGFLPFWIGLTIALAAIPFLVTERLKGTEAQAGLLPGLAMVTAVLSFPLIAHATAWKGKRWVFLTSMTWFCLMMPFLGTVGHWPLLLSGFGQAMILMILAGPAIGGLFVAPYAILADITDYDEQVTGRRREAMYFGVHAFLYNAGMGLGASCASLIFKVLGHTAAQPWGLYLSGVFAAAFTGIGLLIFWGYRLPGRSDH